MWNYIKYHSLKSMSVKFIKTDFEENKSSNIILEITVTTQAIRMQLQSKVDEQDNTSRKLDSLVTP